MADLSLPGPVIVAGVVLLGLAVLARRAGVRAGRAKADAAYRRAGFGSLAGRVVVNAGLIVAGQWAVISLARDWWWVLAALAVPALFAAYPLTRALTISIFDMDEPRRGRR
ncbi:hypothetical protein [Pseudonocardia alaniniphila]|uniref:SdpI/YhfL family protein n=1 Tax=Pseudonocardia alaniniphila TaxID=75291 RepID=A0ABS9T9E9_9PSEU|nr:hypothetical protein [Pseudonocardia alaniniphila]MCH6165164.1 hypothetical protein [Pseudonocardia alaniniphila]